MADELQKAPEIVEPPAATVRRGGRDKPRNVSEPATLGEQEKAIKLAQDQELADLRHLMQDRAFQRYVWRWMTRLKLVTEALPLNSELYVLSAERRVAARMFKELHRADRATLAQMMADDTLTEEL